MAKYKRYFAIEVILGRSQDAFFCKAVSVVTEVKNPPSSLSTAALVFPSFTQCILIASSPLRTRLATLFPRHPTNQSALAEQEPDSSEAI